MRKGNTKIDYKKVFIRKPSDDQQRLGKIVTSDYAISCVTIHSSVLHTLGFIDKVYRSKKSSVSYSNRKRNNSVKKTLSNLISKFPKNFTPAEIFELDKNVKKFPNFIERIKNNSYSSWKELNNCPIPDFVKKFNKPKSLLNAIMATEVFMLLVEQGSFDGMSDYYRDNSISFSDFVKNVKDYFTKINKNSVKKHSQTIIWEKAFEAQSILEKELGKKFSPKKYGNHLKVCHPSLLEKINDTFEIKLENFKGSWVDFCNHVYSPTIISKIRNNLDVKVRARCSFDVRKGSELNEKKKITQKIQSFQNILGNDFDYDTQKKLLKKLEKSLNKAKMEYEEAKIILQYAKAKKDDNVTELQQATSSLKNKFYYLKRKFKEDSNIFNKKSKALDAIRKYEKKENLINEMIDNRKGQEISMLEQEQYINCINRQKNEKQIPYYTWRFVCDKIDDNLAKLIEKTLEENLNKGCGVNGEDGYINVTSFPMFKSYEFFVDYPKTSNLYKAFKNKGIELSNILINGVARHLNSMFVSCKGETFVNSPMEKTMNGDMLEWVGL